MPEFNARTGGWARRGQQPRIAIIGAGMSGIAAVVKLRKAGYTDLTVYEKAAKPGGTWRENRYPGLSCDVPSHWYSFSFAPNPNWSHRFAYGPEIQAYMEDTAREHGVDAITHFNTAITALRYEAPVWHLTTTSGEQEVFDVVIAATGILHHPSVPDIPGLQSFAGQSFHTARWDDTLDLRGKRVGVIGTGSTSAQIVGAIADKVQHLSLFQRTPQWMYPLLQKPYPAYWKALLRRFPVLARMSYWFYYYVIGLIFSPAVLGRQPNLRLISWMCRRNLAKNVPDAALRARLTPDYQAACKRLIFCSDFYPAISRENAELVTDGIAHIEERGVRTRDGRLHELDTLVLATGFDVGKFILPCKVTGENARDLESFWGGIPRAHRSVAVPGFPNFWMLEGPTGPVGNLSLITISEWQLDYVIAALDRMRRDGLLAMAPRQSAFERYNAAMAQAVRKTVWFTGGCQSWYLDRNGVPNLYPWTPGQFRRDMHRPDFGEFRLLSTPAELTAPEESTVASAPLSAAA